MTWLILEQHVLALICALTQTFAIKVPRKTDKKLAFKLLFTSAFYVSMSHSI